MSAGCGAGERCAARDAATGTAAPATANARLCEDDLRLTRRDVEALVTDYADLEGCLPAGGGGLGQRVSGHREAPVPIDLGVDALQRAIVYGVTAWEPVVREAAGLSPERTEGVRPGWALTAAVAVMAPRVALISTLGPQTGFWDGWDSEPSAQDGLDALRALQRLHSRARVMLGRTRLVQRLPGPCSGCGVEALRREDGSTWVHCAGCGRRWAQEAYERYVGLMLDALGA